MIKFFSDRISRTQLEAAKAQVSGPDAAGTQTQSARVFSGFGPLPIRRGGMDTSARPRNTRVSLVHGGPRAANAPSNDRGVESPQALNAGFLTLRTKYADKTVVAEHEHGELTERIYDALRQSGKAHYCHRDDDATVLPPFPMTEFHQKRLIRATIESAERLAIITSYNVNPLKDNEPDKISATMFSILESLAKRQSERDFSFVFLYNDNKLQTNAPVAAVLGQNVVTNMTLQSRRKTQATTTWPAVVEKYNQQQLEESLKIRRLDCNVYFVPAKAKGLAGSHHNKFCINDTGVAATLGASIANKTKDSWLDSGCVTISGTLAARQRYYFMSDLVGRHKVHCGRLRMDPLGRPVVEKLKELSALERLQNIPVRAPADLEASVSDSRFHQAFASAGMSLSGTKHKVLWIQNPSHGYKNMFSANRKIEGKPIGYALSALFASATKGDTINIVNKTIGNEGQKLITDALQKGCHVNVVIDQQNRAHLERVVQRFFSTCGSQEVGRFNIRHFSPTPEFAHEHGLNESLKPVAHAKTYLLERASGSRVVMTGSYNLDGQSHYRSNENAMLFETRDDQLIKGLFREVYDGCASPISSWPTSIHDTHSSHPEH